MSAEGVNISLAHVVVSIMSVRGFVARERPVFSGLGARADLGQVKVDVSSWEDLVLSGRNFSAQPGSD